MDTPSSADRSAFPDGLPDEWAQAGLLTLAHLIQEDQRQRWARGECPLVEDYLRRYPELRDNADAVAVLLFQELRLRQDAGEQPNIDDFAARFPEVVELLRGLLNIYRRQADQPAASGGSASGDRDQATVPPEQLPVATGPFAGGQAPPTRPSVTDSPPAGSGSVPPVCVPGYVVLGKLGEGGMGVVYKAEQTALRRMVALKMILHGDYANEEARRRFQAEAEAVAQLQHPNIVQVHEVSEHNGLPYFSLELCASGSLEKQLNGAPWEPKLAAALVEVLARAMDVAHQAGLVHRDLKPGNVLFTHAGVPKVTDFGLVKRMDVSGHTRSNAIVGTPSYMAPEQAGSNKHVGPAADVYALGAILYELLTGRPPFKAATPQRAKRLPQPSPGP